MCRKLNPQHTVPALTNPQHVNILLAEHNSISNTTLLAYMVECEWRPHQHALLSETSWHRCAGMHPRQPHRGQTQLSTQRQGTT